MAYIIETPNPLEPLTDIRKHEHPGGISIREWLSTTYPGFTEFQAPTICIVNGEAVLREGWDRKIGERDVINFITVPQGEAALLITAIVIAVISLSASLYFVLTAPGTPGEQPESDPVFSTRGQRNAIRLGEPIECCYGRNRIYPSLASRPFFQYIDNDQFQHSLFCLGQGEFEIHDIFIGDTAIDNYQEVDHEVIPPGGDVTLFPTNVFTSPSAGGQEILAPNESTYVAPGWVGPFVANPSGTVTEQIEIDVTFPQGLAHMKSDGGIKSRSITLEVEAREIDDAGAPVGSFFALSFSPFTITLATTTPQRRTLTATTPSGRYEVRVRRTDIKGLRPTRDLHTVVWESLRAFLDSEIDFGDVTLLAVRIRATNNLNNQTQSQFNVVATRKLLVRGSGGFESGQEPVATRSIVWAFVDVFRSLYGARIFDEVFFDWDTLEELDTLYESRNEHFDWIFRDPITVWEAAQTIARVGRAAALLVGSLISLKRDSQLTVPVTMFTPENMVANTFEWNVKLWDLEEHDSLSVEYTEPATGYKQEQVICVLPDSNASADNPRNVRLVGIQDRDHAYHEGLYILAVERYLRDNISFETGLEGYIPTFGDLVIVTHDVPRWSQSGYVVHAEPGAGEDYHLWVSEPLDWSEDSDAEHSIFLRGRKGEVLGPLLARKTTDPKQVLVRIPGEESGAFDFLLGGENEPMIFLFGLTNQEQEYVRIVRIEPLGGETIRIGCVTNNDIIHSFDELEAPALDVPALPPEVPDLPVISNLYVQQTDGTLLTVLVSWTAAFGAQYYVVQTSEDGVTYQERASTNRTAIQLQVRPGQLWIRVAGVNNGQGPWIEEQVTISLISSLDNYVPWDNGTEWAVRWFQVLNAIEYQVKVYDNTGSEPVLKRTEVRALDNRDFLYDLADAQADDNVVREILVEVDVVLEDDETGGTALSGNPATLELSNPIPLAPPESLLTAEIHTQDSDSVTYRLTWDVPYEDDLIRVAVWLSDTMGFDPEVVTPVYDEQISSIGYDGIPGEALVEIALDSSEGHAEHYWRVGLFDVWGNEISTNLTEEQVIPAFP